jgi:hypothetical protein
VYDTVHVSNCTWHIELIFVVYELSPKLKD